MKKVTSVVGVSAMTLAFIAGCGRQMPPEQTDDKQATSEEEQQEFKTLEDRFSYAYGADLAKKFKAEGIELNVDLMAEAMQAVFAGGEGKMSPGEITATMEVYREVYMKKKEADREVAAEKNKKEGAAFLAENVKKPGVVVTKSGLQYKVIKEGKGGYKPTEEDEVKVHYRARFVDGKEFDSTYQRNEPYSVNAKMLIDGWAEAIQMMTEGAKWELYIPAELAYGEKGSDPYVGPNAVLIFEVDLLEIEKK
jgi:FKBP-type peptidyl-prolyl cis-trans isomerase